MFKIPEPTQDVPDGTWKATLLGVTDKEGGSFGDGKYRLWDWLVDVNGEATPFSDTTSQNNGTKTVSYARLTVLLGEAPQTGKEYDPPIGKTVLLQIGRKPNGYPKVDAVLAFVDPQMSAGLPR